MPGPTGTPRLNIRNKRVSVSFILNLPLFSRSLCIYNDLNLLSLSRMSSLDGSAQEPHDTTLIVDQSVSLTIGADSLIILGMACLVLRVFLTSDSNCR